MKRYYFLDGPDRKGPLSVEELIDQSINQETLVWTEGLTNWTKIKDIPDLAKVIPPPIPLELIPPKTNKKIVSPTIPMKYSDPTGEKTWFGKFFDWIKDHKEDILFSLHDPTYLLARLDTEKDYSVKQAVYRSITNVALFGIPYWIYNKLSDNPNYDIRLDNYLHGRPNINGTGNQYNQLTGAYHGYFNSDIISKGDFVGYYYNAPVYEHPLFDDGSAVTYPPNGIWVGNGVYSSNDIYDKCLMAHEYGHWMQYEEFGSVYFYGVIAPASVYFAIKRDSYGWTEYDASTRGYELLKYPSWWDNVNFPANIRVPDFNGYFG